MSQPTSTEIKKLADHLAYENDERYHATFDALLEQKLMTLDPEWMHTMQALYKQSGLHRWCA